MSEHDISRLNSQKLDRVLLAVEGTPDYPGINMRLAIVEKVLFGKEGAGGLVQQHVILWRIHVWILCTLSGLLGTALTLLVQRFLKAHP